MQKIFVVMSKKNTSGGGESLHQLVDKLREYDVNAYLYFFDGDENTKIEKFNKYNTPVTKNVEDHKNNIVIVPEVYSGFLSKIKNAKRVIWWLSVDFFNHSTPQFVAQDFLKKKHLPLSLTKVTMAYAWLTNKYSRIPRFSFNKISFSKEKDIYHYYNCEYARQKLISLGVPSSNMSYLCGPLSIEHMRINDVKNVKEDIIAYNPKKGLEYTEKIISYSKKNNLGLTFKKIENMSTIEVKDLLKEAKIYIDFGFFPGPERIPREAVLEDCIIVTSKDGAAGNKVDVPIPNKYKFEKKDSNIGNIALFLEECINDYEYFINDFISYRRKVINQNYLFEREVKRIAEESKVGVTSEK